MWTEHIQMFKLGLEKAEEPDIKIVNIHCIIQRAREFQKTSTSVQSTLCEVLGWKKHKLKPKLLGEISITLDTQMTPPSGRKWRVTKEPLDESEGGEWKSWLKTQHSKTKIMASSPITSLKIDRETMETDSILWAPKSLQMVIAAMKLKDTCSLEEKLLPT